MDYGPLVREEIEEGAKLAREFDRYASLKAAFWLKASDDDHRYLYLTSDQIDEAGVYPAYGEVARLTIQDPPEYLDPMRVKVISGKDPLAQAAFEYNNRFPQSRPLRLNWQMFGGTFIEDGYIYPPLVPATAS
jgi:hypothetical protein